MKVFYFFSFLAVAAFAVPIQEDEVNVHGENGWYVPQIDGSLLWLSESDAERKLKEAENQKDGRNVDLNKVNFYLYTKDSSNTPIEITATDSSIKSSKFNAANPTIFTIHGWTGSYKDSLNKDIADAWFTHGDYNAIAVDWARARSLDYATSVVAVPKTGQKVADMINFLQKNYGMSLDTLTVVGHSLGAHVAGYAGKNVNSGQVHTIVGLDPALPLFSYDKPEKRLSSTDGYYVESIQTDGGKLGFLKPIGKGAFYPNGGKSQPGCGLDVTGSCAHGRSVTYYVEAVRKNDFPSIKCSDYEDAVKKDCGSSYSSVRMGAMTNAYMVAGNFYVPVNKNAPYGMGA